MISVDENGGLFLLWAHYSGAYILAPWLVGTIVPQTGHLTEEPSNTLTPPAPLSTPDKTGHLAVNNMTSSEPYPSSKSGLVLLYTPEVPLPSTSSDPLYLQKPLLSREILSPPLPPQPMIFLPPQWHKIPQKRYKQKQWDFRPAEDIPFHVDGLPGVNMEEALREKFTTFEGRDNSVLLDMGVAFSCRIWVGLILTT